MIDGGRAGLPALQSCNILALLPRHRDIEVSRTQESTCADF
jgi:hypothetical protein